MKAKLTVTVEKDLITKARERARVEGVSLSQLIERALTALTSENSTSFSHRWRGRFRRVDRGGPRYDTLSRKYL